MTLTPEAKVQIIAAVAQSPILVEILKQYPSTKWDEPSEYAGAITNFTAALIKSVETYIK